MKNYQERIPMQKITSVLLFGAENIIALFIIRALGQVFPNTKIHTFSPLEQKKSIPERSKYIDSRHYFNSWDVDFSDMLTAKAEETGADIILPVGEKSVRILASLKNQLKNKVHLPPLPSVGVHDQLEKKNLLAELLSKHDFPNAQTWLYNSSYIDNLKETDFPVLMKPINGSSGSGIEKINDRQALENLKPDFETDEYILQEFIPGQDIGVSVLAVDGHIKAYTTQRVLGNKGYGVATAISFIENKPVYEYTRRLLELTGYNGLAHLDFRVDDRDGAPKLIDFNARFWYSLLGSKAAGVDFTLLYCLSAMDIPFNRPEYANITYFAGMNTLRYYFKKIFKPKTNSYQADNNVYTDLWDRLGDPIPELARYIKINKA